MSRQRRRQPKTDAALVQTVATLANQVAELTRRMSPADAAHGTPLPAHIVNPPRVQRTPQLDQVGIKGDANMGVPSQQMMNQMLANQAPQDGSVGIYAPGAPLQVVPGIESPYGPRIWDYPYGYNIAALPRSTERTSFQELRDLSDLYYGIRMCQRVIDDVLNRLELKIGWDDGVIPEGESETDVKWKKLTQPVYDFLSCPDGESSLSEWLIKSVRDVQELGQSIIYIARNKGKDIVRLDVVDATLIKPLLDQRGRLPQPPFPAFEQFIKGIPAGLYASDVRGTGTEDIRLTWKASQMHLIREMARTDSIYSRSRVEDVLLVINQALRKQNLDLTRYTDGSTPEGMLFIDPTYVEGSNDQWAEVERSLNGVYSGNDRMRARLKIMPPGLRDYKETRSPDPQIDFDRWLLNITCGIFGVTMAEIGMTQDVNRSSGESQENVIYRRVVQPLANKYAQFLTKIVKQQYDKRMRVSWGGIEEREDQLQKAQTYDIGVKNGSMAASTMARLMGWPVDKEVPPFVLFNGGPQAVVVLDDMDALRKQQLQSFQTQTQQAEAGLENTKLQGQQLQMVLDQQKQNQQQGGEQGQGGEGENEPEPNGLGGGGAGGQEAPEEGEGESEEAPPEQESGENEGESEQPQEGGDEEPGPDDEAAAEVDRLIAEAKKRQQSKGKQQRMQVADDVRWDALLADERSPALLEQMGDDALAESISDEWRRYRDVALRAVKRQQSVPAFTSDVLPQNLHAYATEALQLATTPDAVRAVFSDIREAETHPSECRCMVCGCGLPLTDHSMPYAILQPGEHNTGCMVAFFLPASASQQLAVEGGIPQQDMHITLAMLSHDIEQEPVDKARLLACVKQWATAQQPIAVALNKSDTFPAGDNGVPVIVRSETPALMDLRADLVAALDGAGIAIDQTFPEYKPHVTLMYVPEGESIPELPEPDVQVALSQVWVAYGDERYSFPLGGDDKETVSLDVLRALRADVLRAIDGEVMPPFVTAAMVPQETRWAEHEIVRGAGGKIIGNIYDGVFHPAEGVSHEHVREVLALHEDGSKARQAMATYLSAHDDLRAAQARHAEAQDVVKKAIAQYTEQGYKEEDRTALEHALEQRSAAERTVHDMHYQLSLHGVMPDFTGMPGGRIDAIMTRIYPDITWGVHSIDSHIANQMLPELKRLALAFPGPFSTIRRVDMSDPSDFFTTHPTATAYVRTIISAQTGRITNEVHLNPVHWSGGMAKVALTDMVEHSVAAHWLAPDGPPGQAIMAHEFGHVVYQWMLNAHAEDGDILTWSSVVHPNGFGTVADLVERWGASYTPAHYHLSDYGRTNAMEAFAEAFMVAQHPQDGPASLHEVRSMQAVINAVFGEHAQLRALNEVTRYADLSPDGKKQALEDMLMKTWDLLINANGID